MSTTTVRPSAVGTVTAFRVGDKILLPNATSGLRVIDIDDFIIELADDSRTTPANGLATLNSAGKHDVAQINYTTLSFVASSTVAALPAPGTLTSGQFYIVTDTGTNHGKTWTQAREMAISDGTNYHVGPVGIVTVDQGGTGATTAAGARTNLEVYSQNEVNDRQLSKQPSNGLNYKNNQTDKVTVASSALLQVGDGTNDKPFSCAAIVRANDYTSFAVCGRESTASLQEWYFQFDASDKLSLSLFDESASASHSIVQDTANVTDGEAVHVAFTYDGTGGASAANGVTLYVNGVAVAATNTPSGTYTAAEALSQVFEIGLNSKSGADADGEVHSVVCFNRELTAAQVAELVTSCNAPEVADQWGGADSYTSDFSSGVDGWSFDAGTLAGNIDSIGSRDDNLRLTLNTANSGHYAIKENVLTVGQRYRVTYSVYIPTQSNLDSYRITDGSVGHFTDSSPTLDAWIDSSVEFVATDTDVRFDAGDGGVFTFADAGGDDVIYIRNVIVTPIGAVMALLPENISDTWRDASSNGLHGTKTGVAAIKQLNVIEVDAPSPASGADLLRLLNNGSRVHSVDEAGVIHKEDLAVDAPVAKFVADPISTAGTLTHQIAIDIGGTTFYLPAYTHGS